MTKVVVIHKDKQPNRPHCIPEWAERRHFDSQAALAAELGADKSVVSRWYSGATPSLKWQNALAALFSCDRESLFLHPDDDWLSRFFRGRSQEEIDKIKTVMELSFPRRSGTED
jgi:hypothetical protein